MSVHQTKIASQVPYVSPGMPALDARGKAVSLFEFWPVWLIYLPVMIQWCFLSIRFRSLTLPFIANPKLSLAGMVGVPKSELLHQAGEVCGEAILPWFVHQKSERSYEKQLQAILAEMQKNKFEFPIVCKPDIGCRGNGVQLVESSEALAQYFRCFPLQSSFIVQKLASWEPEAGIFYVREPDQKSGRIVSMALKYSPYVLGDGVSTVEQLIDKDARAGKLKHLYIDRHRERLGDIPAKNQSYRLVFSASHCQGAIFRNAQNFVTPELTDKVDFLMKDIPEFYYGRLDVKFSNTDRLKEGCDLEIVEINSASSESLHIWDKDTSLWEAIRALLWQYRTLFSIGNQNRRRGYKTPHVSELLSRWRLERKLTRCYPATD